MTARLVVTARDVRLVREQGECLIYSYEVAEWPGGVRTPLHAAHQPREWHEGQALLALARKLAAYRKRHR